MNDWWLKAIYRWRSSWRRIRCRTSPRWRKDTALTLTLMNTTFQPTMSSRSAIYIPQISGHHFRWMIDVDLPITFLPFHCLQRSISWRLIKYLQKTQFIVFQFTHFYIYGIRLLFLPICCCWYRLFVGCFSSLSAFFDFNSLVCYSCFALYRSADPVTIGLHRCAW